MHPPAPFPERQRLRERLAARLDRQAARPVLRVAIEAATLSPMPITPILATLGYVLSPDGERVLMLTRGNRAGDAHAGKVNGLGGKLERGENAAAGMRREIMEEAGIAVTRMRLRGTLSWPGFGGGGEDWMALVFLIEGFSGEPLTENPEGTLSWEPLERVLGGKLPMWDGDRHFLPLVFDNDPRPFFGVMPYENGRHTGWAVERW